MLFNIDNSLSPFLYPIHTYTHNEKRTLRFLFFLPSIVIIKKTKKEKTNKSCERIETQKEKLNIEQKVLSI